MVTILDAIQYISNPEGKEVEAKAKTYGIILKIIAMSGFTTAGDNLC